MKPDEIRRKLEEIKQLEYLERIHLALSDPWYFMTGYEMGDRWTPGESKGFCYTLDEHDAKSPLKRFPNKEYLWHVVHEWHHHPLLVIAKSRQIMVTWSMVSYALWYALHRKGQLSFFQNKKENDAMEMLRRAKVIYHALPDVMKQLRPLKIPENAKELEIVGRLSRIKAIPQGADVLRMNTASQIISDETAFQEQAQEAYTAAKPTISGGGRYAMVSTANGKNFFYGMWADHEGASEQLMKGVRAWDNANGFRALEVHYSADPEKDVSTEAGKEWYEENRRGYTPEGWDREMEINFQVGGGRKMFEDFRRSVHCRKLTVDKSKPLYVSWDWGFIHPAVLWAQIGERDQLKVVRELQGTNVDIWRFAPEVLRITKEFGCGLVHHFCDPAGKKRNDQTEMSTMDLVRTNFKVPFRYRRIDRRTRIDWVRRLLMIREDGEPGILIDDTACPILVGGFEGGYVSDPNDPELPAEDDVFEHLQDDLQYIIANTYTLLGLHHKVGVVEEKKLAQGRVAGATWTVRNKFTGY